MYAMYNVQRAVCSVQCACCVQCAVCSVQCAVYSVLCATLVQVTGSDFTSYRCVAKNSLGETDGKIRLYGGWTDKEKEGIFQDEIHNFFVKTETKKVKYKVNR